MGSTRWAGSATATLTALLGLWMLAGTGAVQAQAVPSGGESGAVPAETATTVSQTAESFGAGSWMVRSLVLGALIDGQSEGPLSLDTGEDIAVGADVTYFLSDRLALNLLAAFVTPEVTSDAEGVPPSLGSVKAVPPALTLQFHLAPEESVRPYVGAGVSYTNFFDVTGTLDEVDAEIEDGLGVAGQAGVNIPIHEAVSFAADFRWVFILNDPEVTTTLADDELKDLNWPIIAVGLGFHP